MYPFIRNIPGAFILAIQETMREKDCGNSNRETLLSKKYSAEFEVRIPQIFHLS